MSRTHGDPNNAEDKAKLDAHFERVAESYEKDGMGLQNTLCRKLLTLTDEFKLPITKSSVVLDNAAGPGILTGELIKQLSDSGVSESDFPEMHAADFSAAMIKVLNAKGWGEKHGVKAAVMDAQDLQYPDEMFTHSFMNLGIFALPDPLKGTKEIFRTLAPGGITLVTTIRGNGWLPLLHTAQKAIKPDATEFQPIPPEWTKSEKLKGLLEDGGFKNVEIREAGASFDMKDFSANQKHLIKLTRDFIVKDWSDEEATAFDEKLAQVLDVEAKSGIPRSMDIWVGIATK